MQHRMARGVDFLEENLKSTRANSHSRVWGGEDKSALLAPGNCPLYDCFVQKKEKKRGVLPLKG